MFSQQDQSDEKVGVEDDKEEIKRVKMVYQGVNGQEGSRLLQIPE
jgi:hypothetical protein